MRTDSSKVVASGIEMRFPFVRVEGEGEESRIAVLRARKGERKREMSGELALSPFSQMSAPSGSHNQTKIQKSTFFVSSKIENEKNMIQD